MSDWFTTSLLLQQEMLAASQAQFELARAAVNLDVPVDDAVDAAREAAEANLRVMQTFASYWGWM